MVQKKIQETPLPEAPQPEVPEQKDVPKIAVNVPVPPAPSSRFSIPSLTKTPPNELYRKLLPAILFVLTFVTVMTMLLIYMDTVATLVAYVRHLHMAPRPPKNPPPEPKITDRVEVLDRLYGELYNETFVEFLPSGGRDPTMLYLERVRGWRGVAVRAAPRDFLALRGAASALHACLSPTPHPREVQVSYQEEEEGEGGVSFRSRVLCLPLHTVLLAADATRAAYTLLAAGPAPAALSHLPFTSTRLQVIEVRSSDMAARNKTSDILLANNYTVVANFHDSVMFALTDSLTRARV
ncbi:unnamed protein product [Leptidea sinapis]|uniref:Uncharacterized protein n=1 Tax=Leptidea sinapis TaxID=189913 RepID=A0A5E4PQ03_9NEOP|nr:unnamed protein product [Leptidea sinapis]